MRFSSSFPADGAALGRCCRPAPREVEHPRLVNSAARCSRSRTIGFAIRPRSTGRAGRMGILARSGMMGSNSRIRRGTSGCPVQAEAKTSAETCSGRRSARCIAGGPSAETVITAACSTSSASRAAVCRFACRQDPPLPAVVSQDSPGARWRGGPGRTAVQRRRARGAQIDPAAHTAAKRDNRAVTRDGIEYDLLRPLEGTPRRGDRLTLEQFRGRPWS